MSSPLPNLTVRPLSGEPQLRLKISQQEVDEDLQSEGAAKQTSEIKEKQDHLPKLKTPTGSNKSSASNLLNRIQSRSGEKFLENSPALPTRKLGSSKHLVVQLDLNTNEIPAKKLANESSAKP